MRWIFVALWVGASIAGSAAADRLPITNFAIDRTEVTVAQFRTFLAATRQNTAAERDGGGFEYAGGWVRREGWTYQAPQARTAQDQEPAAHVSWLEAQAYCQWAGGRLPSAEEWRLAAYTEMRAEPSDGFERARTYPYPVGLTPDGMNTNRRHHLPVGVTKRGVNGLYDMGANLWEWLSDRRAGEALTAGGSWWYGPAQSRSDAMQWKDSNFYALYIGFRCAYAHPNG